MHSELAHHQERVRAALLDGLPEGPAVSSDQIIVLRAAMREGTETALRNAGAVADVRVDRQVLPRLLRCPASAIGDPFAWTATFANRTLGIGALELIVRDRLNVKDALTRVLADAIGRGGDLGDWLAGQAPPARAATVSAASTWVNRALVAVPWRALGQQIAFDVRTRYPPLGRNSPVVYCGRTDAEFHWRGARARESVLLSVGWPDPVVARLDLLIRTLETGRAPLRHVAVYPATGAVTITQVDVEALERGVEECVAAASALVDIRRGEPPATDPGGHCWWCSQLPDCAAGQAWTLSQPVRIGGIPLPASS